MSAILLLFILGAITTFIIGLAKKNWTLIIIGIILVFMFAVLFILLGQALGGM